MKRHLITLFICSLALAACGGGSGGSSDSEETSERSTEVIPGTAARFETTSLEFGLVAVGSSKTRTAVLHNDGSVEADFSRIEGLPSGFTASGCDSVPAGGSCELTVKFRPLGYGARSSADVGPARADVVSNRLFVRGSGIDPCLGSWVPAPREDRAHAQAAEACQ